MDNLAIVIMHPYLRSKTGSPEHMVLAASGHLTTSLGVGDTPDIGSASPKEGGNRNRLGASGWLKSTCQHSPWINSQNLTAESNLMIHEVQLLLESMF